MSESWTGSKEDASRAAIDEILGPLVADGKCPRCGGDKSVVQCQSRLDPSVFVCLKCSLDQAHQDRRGDPVT